MLINFIYVNDLGLLTNTITLMARIKTLLCSNFTVKDLSKMHKILGIKLEIDQHGGTIKLSQGHYIDVSVQWFNLDKALAIDTPVAKGIKSLVPWPKEESSPEVPYVEAIGCLMYAALGSQPDIAFTMQQLSQHCHDFNIAHLTAVKHIILNLKGTCDLGIVFRRSTDNSQIDIYTDADFANLADSKSIGDYFCIYCMAAASLLGYLKGNLRSHYLPLNPNLWLLFLPPYMAYGFIICIMNLISHLPILSISIVTTFRLSQIFKM
jgi:Reverse transcriptase (RNA-dependent DNA polymerase)